MNAGPCFLFPDGCLAPTALQPRLSRSLPQIWQTSVNKEMDDAKVFPAGLTVAL